MVLLLGQHPSKPRSFAVVPAEEVCYNRLKCKTLWNEGKKMQDRLMTKMSDYYYDLPQELIAQTPLERRDSSRLMVSLLFFGIPPLPCCLPWPGPPMGPRLFAGATFLP